MEADTFDGAVTPLSITENSAQVVGNPNRDSFFDWISTFLKPNQSPSPVLPIGDPPENCPACRKKCILKMMNIYNCFLF